MGYSEKIFNPGHKANKYYNYRREEMLCFVPDDVIKVLDVGCGAGNFGEALKSQRDVEVWGVEICKEVAEEAMTKLDNVLMGDIENADFPLPLTYFDCIVFNDVLEHLRYPWIVLRNLRKNLTQNGYIVASIPNVRYIDNVKNLLFHKKWGYEEDGILDKTHLRFFTYKSIEDMFKSCGYNVVKIEGIRDGFSWKVSLLNKFLFGLLDDMRYLQFACVSQKTK